MQLIWYALLALLALAAVQIVAGRRRHKRLKLQCEAAFQHAYAGWSPSPTFEMTSSYGYPAFKVIFRSKSERDAAERAGANTAFAHAIQDLCGNRGPESHPFRAEQAIFFSYAGYVEEMLARMRS